MAPSSKVPLTAREQEVLAACRKLKTCDAGAIADRLQCNVLSIKDCLLRLYSFGLIAEARR